MANWFAEDSNLNTLCQSCNKPTVPLLTIIITGKHIQPPCDPFSVPYLNPLVLRKELENILTQEGDLSLAEWKFVDEHPIIYWNLIWTFERINIQTHLPNLYLKIRNNNDTIITTTTTRNDNVINSNNNTAVADDDDIIDNNNDASLVDVLEDGNSLIMQPVEEGTDPLTQELASLGKSGFFLLFFSVPFFFCLSYYFMYVYIFSF